MCLSKDVEMAVIQKRGSFLIAMDDGIDNIAKRASEEIHSSRPTEMIFSSFGFRSPIISEKYANVIPQDKSIKEKTCLIIPFAGFNFERTAELEKEGLVNFGFAPDNVIAFSDDVLSAPMFIFDYIYVPGGDPFKLLSEIKKRSLRSEIRHRVLTYKTAYIGVSSGAYVASNNIEYVKQLEDDNWGENDYEALGLVPNPIICHKDHY